MSRLKKSETIQYGRNRDYIVEKGAERRHYDGETKQCIVDSQAAYTHQLIHNGVHCPACAAEGKLILRAEFRSLNTGRVGRRYVAQGLTCKNPHCNLQWDEIYPMGHYELSLSKRSRSDKRREP